MNIIEQIHRSLPKTYTPENLAKFITEQQKQVINHIDKVPLTPEEISEFEHKSSLASRAIIRLDEVKEEFMLAYKKGTPPTGDGETYEPQTVTIPPTKGVDALKKNREYAEDILEKGYTETVTDVYLIPFPEESMMVAMTIEGYECPDYTRKMSEDEDALYGKLFVKENGELMQLDNSQVSVNGDGSARIKTNKRATRKPFI